MGGEPDEISDADYQREIDARSQQVQNDLCAGRAVDALPKALANPPLLCKNQDLKDRNTETVGRVIGGIKDGQIESSVSKLSLDECDILMKYVYKLLGSGENCGSLLKWHEATFKKAGMGCIVRAMCERRSV